MLRYAWRDLVRNPRRTLASLVGVVLGVGLFSAVLFFIDGSGKSMTKRAIAPLALDMQRVLTSPLGGGLRLEERLSPSGPLHRGQRARITLTVTNHAASPANEVVVNDQPAAPLAYVRGSTTLNGRTVADRGDQIPLAHGPGRIGLNIGTVRPGSTVRLAYDARAGRPVGAPGKLPLGGTISSRENVVPDSANAPPLLSLPQLLSRARRIPGVAAADGLSFVDLLPGALQSGGSTIRRPVRVFGFDRRYQRHYPSIRLAAGSFAPGSALLSAEAARSLAAKPGATVELSLPGRRGPLSLPVGGVLDLSRAKPLFNSRKASKLEEFLYVPDSVVVSPATFRRDVIPAFRAASASRGRLLKSLPLEELDLLVDRSRLRSDPATALAQTRAVAGSVKRVAPGQDYLIDNISNTLEVARADAAVARRMFLFLGLPAVLLAAFLAAYAGSVLASTQRREHANLRLRGAHRGHLRRILAYRTLAFAGAGSIAGAAIGFLSAMAVLGRATLFEASSGQLLTSAIVALGAGMLTTGLALYVPGRRSLSREVGDERREMAVASLPAWRRRRLDYALLGVAAVAEAVAFRAGAFDAATGSVSTGQSTSLPSHLLLLPLAAWFGGALLAVRAFTAVAARLPAPAPPRFGPLIRGIVGRSLKRRSWTLAAAMAGMGLVIAFGTGLAVFAATYNAAKAADSRFTVGSDIRLTPSALSHRSHPPGYAAQLRVPGVAAVTPVAAGIENAVLIGPYNEDVKDLTAIVPPSFRRVAALSDSFFPDRPAARELAALESDPGGILVDTATASDLEIGRGDRVQVLLARGTKHQRLRRFRVVGLFDRFPGFPEGVHIVANLSRYQSATGLRQADFFLARTTDHSHAGLASALSALRSGPLARDPVNVDTTETTLNKDQSSLTAVNVHGLVDLDSFYTLLMSATVVGIFVFGLLLQRRREYVTLRAQGMRTRTLEALILAETAFVGACGLAAGVVIGIGIGYLLVHILQPLFILVPAARIPLGDVARLGILVVAATLATTLAALGVLRRLSPTEVLREQ